MKNKTDRELLDIMKTELPYVKFGARRSDWINANKELLHRLRNKLAKS